MYIIYSFNKSDTCPICNSKMESKSWGNEESHARCKNECYYEEFAYGATSIYVFDKKFYAYYTITRTIWEETKKQIREEIEYWKENDRYLMKALTGE